MMISVSKWKSFVLSSKGILLERGDRVDPVPGMELAERRAQHPVLKPAQDAIATNLYNGIPPRKAPFGFFEHPRAEDGVRLRRHEGGPYEIRKTFWRVLTVAVQQRDVVETPARSRSGIRYFWLPRSPD